jgi:hypothetical protein
MRIALTALVAAISLVVAVPAKAEQKPDAWTLDCNVPTWCEKPRTELQFAGRFGNPLIVVYCGNTVITLGSAMSALGRVEGINSTPRMVRFTQAGDVLACRWWTPPK